MNIRNILSASFLAFCIALLSFSAFAAGDGLKVVYHINEGNEQASNGLRNIRNHLAEDPTAKITVVTHAKGIDFLLQDAKDKNGQPFDAAVHDLVKQGVTFKVCNNTLTARGIDKNKVLTDAQIVPSGAVEVARLQAKEGFAYFRP